MIDIIDGKHIPRLVEDYSIIPYDKNVFTLCIEAVRPIKLNIDYHTKQLLELMDGKRNLEEITDQFNSGNSFDLTINDTVQIFKERIVGFGILEGDGVGKIKIKDNYLRLRIVLFSTQLVTILASYLKFLFEEKLFKILFAGAFALLFFSFYFFLDFTRLYVDTDPAILTFSLVLNIVAVVLHEFGHAAACLKFGARNGPIGFGFYIVAPVLYSDVTDAWRLSRKYRVIVDLAGIYIQMLTTCMVVLVFFFTSNVMYLQIAFWMSIATAINLSPFLRYDGYWALSDLMRISNLKDKSQLAVSCFFGRIIGINKTWKFKNEQRFLLIYGLSRFVVLVGFIIYMLGRPDSLLAFPNQLIDTITTLIYNFESIDFDWVKATLARLFLPILFLFLVSQELVKYIKKKIKNKG